jgi:hypothetical protein
MTDYLVWEAHWKDGWCRLGDLENVDESYRLLYGESYAKEFPAKARFKMDPDFPNDTLLADCLLNLLGELVVSQPVVELLQREKLPKVEYLPVKVLDHRGRSVGQPYSIVHPVSPVDCLDIKACEPTWSASDPEDILFLKHLVIDAKRVEPKRRLFRCASHATPKIIHRSLAKALTAAKLTGLKFLELKDYQSR